MGVHFHPHRINYDICLLNKVSYIHSMLEVIIDFDELGLGLFLLELTNCYDDSKENLYQYLHMYIHRPPSILLFNMIDATAIYTFDSDLVWKMQLMIIKG